MAVRTFTIAVFAAAAAAFCDAAAAQSLYDRKLERLILEKVASRIGDIRPGFGPGQKPVLVLPLEPRPAEPVARGTLHWPQPSRGADPLSLSEARLLEPFARQRGHLREFTPGEAARVVYF